MCISPVGVRVVLSEVWGVRGLHRRGTDGGLRHRWGGVVWEALLEGAVC